MIASKASSVNRVLFMLSRIKHIVKTNSFIYLLYFFLGSTFLKLLGLFIRTDEKLILYVVYGGQRYDDSPKCVYEYIQQESKTVERYKQYKHIWAFVDPKQMENEIVPSHEMVRIDSLAFFIWALKAKYWITNSSVSRGLDFKKKDTINVLFEHGTAGIKKLGRDLPKGNRSFGSGFEEKFDFIIVQGKQEEPILRRAWNLKDDCIFNIGLPRNDELAALSFKRITAVKEKLLIPKDKKVILYAPTYREYKVDSSLRALLNLPLNIDKMYKELGDKYILLLTGHYEISCYSGVPDNHPFVVNAIGYPHINDLLIVSDVLITDYSSVVFDYAILGRPIIAYTFDYDEYEAQRGIYDGYESIFSNGIQTDEEEVIGLIKSLDDYRYSIECDYTKKRIRDVYISNYGAATKKSVELIFG